MSEHNIGTQATEYHKRDLPIVFRTMPPKYRVGTWYMVGDVVLMPVGSWHRWEVYAATAPGCHPPPLEFDERPTPWIKVRVIVGGVVY